MAFGPTTEYGAALFRLGGKFLVLIAKALLILAIAGCTVGPNYRTLTMKLPVRWDSSDQQMQLAQNQGARTDLATASNPSIPCSTDERIYHFANR